MATGNVKPTLVLSICLASADNWSVSANSYDYKDINITGLDGRTPIGVVGIDVFNASSSGSNANNIAINRFQFLNNGKVRVGLRNVASSAAKVKCVANVLCSNV